MFLGSGLNELMTYRRKNKLNVIIMGVKLFSKNKGASLSACKYRIRMEGLEIILPFLSNKRVIEASRELFAEFTKAEELSLSLEYLTGKGFP